jgi:hypothetical protein
MEGVAKGPAVPPWLRAQLQQQDREQSGSPAPPSPQVSARTLLKKDKGLAKLLKKVAKQKVKEELKAAAAGTAGT